MDCRLTCLTFNRTLFERAFDIKMPQRAMRRIIINKNIYVCSSARVRAPKPIVVPSKSKKKAKSLHLPVAINHDHISGH